MMSLRRPSPSLADMIATLLFWVGVLFYGIGEFCLALIGLFVCTLIVLPPIFLFFSLLGVPPLWSPL
jgi:hypothetical protein